MKQKLLNFTRLRSLVLLAVIAFLGAGQAWGADETITFSSLYSSNTTLDGTAINGTDFSVTFNKRNGGTATQYYTNGTAVRWYGGGTLVVASSTKTIEKIEITFTQTANSISANVGNYESGTWTGSASSVTFTQSGTSGHCRISSITVTYASGGGSLTASDLTITGAPVALSFDLYNNSSAQTVNFTTSSTGAVTVSGGTGYVTTSVSGNTITVTPTAVTPSAQTITISQAADDDYYAGTATFTVSIANSNPDVPGTENSPYTVAQARAAIDAGTGITDVYVTGIISQIDSYNSSYGSITYWISDDGTTTDQLEVYSGLGIDGATFSSKDDIVVGASVVVCGTLKKYNSTYEFNYNNYQTSYSAPAIPRITANNVTLEYDATSGEIAYTIDNPATGVNLTASLQQGIDWISNITVTSDKVTFTTTANEGNDDRSATITLSYTGATDKVITVTQKHYVADYATLPFSFDGGSSAIANTAGLTQESLGSDYNNSPKLKFDGTGDFVILKINERPGTLSYTIKGNSFSSGSTSTFKVQTSEDGTLYTDLATYTELGDAQNESFSNLGKDVRYIKWIYTEKGATNGGNVALGNISLTAYVTPVPFDLTVTLNDNIDAIFVFNTADENEPLIEDGAAGTVQVVAGTEIMVSPDVASGYVLESLTVGGQDMTSQIDGSGAYTFTMPSQAVTITATAIASAPVTGDKYVKVTSTDDLKDGQYLIVYEDGSVAFNGGLETLDAANNTIAVTINNSEIAVTSATEAAEFTIDVTAGTIKSASGFYIGRTGDSNGMNSSATEAYTNTISFTDGNADIVSSGSAYMRYNATSGQDRFRYFKSSSYTNQKAIQLYKKVAPTTESVTVGAAGYTTYVPQNNVSFPTGVSGYIVTNVGATSIHLEEMLAVPAGTPVVVKATQGSYDLEVVDNNDCDDVTANLLHASDGTVTGDGTIWALAMFDNKVGFNVVGNGVTIPEGKAYLVISSEIKGFLTFDFDSEDAIKGVEAISENGVIFNLAGQRVNKAQKGIYIVNGKKVLVK